MTTAHFVDTHAFLRYLAGTVQLDVNARRVLDDPTSELVIPATALAEPCWIVEQGRMDLSVSQVLAAVDGDPRITIISLDRAVVERSNELTSISEIHDRQIVASALIFQDRGRTVDLLTKDANITSSGCIATVW